MSTFAIKINGVDVTDSVIIKDCEFNSAAKGAAGEASFRVRDEAHMYSFSTGHSLTLDVDGQRVWTGFVAKIERGYFFEADCRCKTAIIPRYLRIVGTDVNVLLHKRILYDHDTPERMKLDVYPEGTFDSVVLTNYLTDFTDIGDDGVTFGLIEHVGTPSKDTGISGSASWTVDELCRMIVYNTGAIYYIDPDKVFVLTDVDTPNAEFGISDTPGAGEIGCREFEIDYDGSGLRNDALVWGAGQGSSLPVFGRSTSQVSIDEHGLWQVGDFANSVFRQATINHIAHTYVFGSPQNKRGGKDDRVSIKLAVFEPSFRVAQKVNVRSEVFDYEDVIPIRAQKITFPTHQDVRFDLILSHDIDDPWSTFEFWFPKIILPPFPDIILPEIPGILPPSDPCRGVGGDGGTNCIETFSRTVTTGLGVSEITGFTGPTMPWASVDGDEAKIEEPGTPSINMAFPFQWPDGAIQPSQSHFNTSINQLFGSMSWPVEVVFTGRVALETGFGRVYPRINSNDYGRLGFLFSAAANFNPAFGFEIVWCGATGLVGTASQIQDSRAALLGQVQSGTIATQLVDITRGDAFKVRLLCDGSTAYVKAWNATFAEPLAWSVIFPVSVQAPPDRMMWFSGLSPGQNFYIDGYEIVDGLICNGGGSVSGTCDSPADTAVGFWTKSSATGYDPSAVNGFDIEHVLVGSGVNDVYDGGRLDFNVNTGSPVCVGGSFVITKKGSGSGGGNPGSILDIYVFSNQTLRFAWDASPFSAGYYQFSLVGGQYKVWRTDDGEPDAWSSLTGAQNFSLTEGVSYSYRIQYSGSAGSSIGLALEATQGPAGVSFNSAVSFSQPEISMSSGSGLGDVERVGSSCIEDYTRVVSSGFGTSPIGPNLVWVTNQVSPTIVDVNGAFGEVINQLGTTDVQALGPLPFEFPIEILHDFQIAQNVPTSTTVSMSLHFDLRDAGTGALCARASLASGGSATDTSLKISVSTATGNSGQVIAFGSVTDWDANEGHALRLRMYVTSGLVLAKVWDWENQPEPGWQASVTSPVAAPTEIQYRPINITTRNAHVFRYDRLAILRGLDCGDSCFGDDPSAPDTSTRRLCETLTRIDPPENASEEYAYYQASYSMAFGSDEVWIDGIRIDTRDYTLYGLRDVVAIYDRFSVGGLDASDPPKTVHACYIAVGLVVT